MSQTPADSGSPQPIVVVSGLPRSGTSMAMKMLEAGGFAVVQDGIRTADEDNPKGYYEHERIKRLAKESDKTWIQEARGKVIKVISFLVPHLPTSGESYRIVFMHRRIEEVLASQARMIERRGETSDTPDAVMKQVYQKHLDDVARTVSERPDCTLLDIHHNEAIEDPDGQAARIAEFLGLPADRRAAMAAQVDGKLYRNREA